MDGRVDGVVREVEQERMVPVLADEADRFIGVAFDEAGLLLLGEKLGHLFVAKEGDNLLSGLLGPLQHVVGIGKAEVVVEPLPRREELGLVADVPLAHALRRVAALLQPFGDGELGGIEAMGFTRKEHARHRDADPVAAGEQLRPRHGADRCGVEGRELHALARHAVEVRRPLPGRTEGPDVGVAHVVDKNDDDVGLGRFGFGRSERGQRREQQDGEKGCEFHG